MVYRDTAMKARTASGPTAVAARAKILRSPNDMRRKGMLSAELRRR
jgi:hypothetical protein